MLEENRNKIEIKEEDEIEEKKRKRNKFIVITLFIIILLVIIICFVVIAVLNGGDIKPNENCGSNGGTCPVGIDLLNLFH